MNTFFKIFFFYYDGFKNMKLGKILWRIIAIKILLIFLVINYITHDKSLRSEYKNDKEKASFVYENLKGE